MCEQHLDEDEHDARLHGAVSFVDELMVALTNARIYSHEHPRARSSMAVLHEGLLSMLSDSSGSPVQLGAADGFIFHAGRPLLGASLSARRLVDLLSKLEAGGLEFGAATDLAELQRFVTFASRSGKGAGRFDEANRALEQKGCKSIRFLPPYHDRAGSRVGEAAQDWANRLDRAMPADPVDLDHEFDLDVLLPARLYQGTVGVLQDSMVQACSGEPIDTAAATGHVESILSQLSTEPMSILRLARYEKYDEFTFGHSIRVCLIALNFARHLTTDEALVQRIGLAALLHDIGKAWVPFDVLHSRERLSEAERAEMNMHPVHGGQILLESRNPDPLAVAVAFSHHQNQDGSGYPRSVRVGHPSAASMIVKLADVFEALTAARPYKPRMAPTRAYRIMLDMQGHFDPVLLRRFIEVNGIYPVGSRVLLSNGEVGRVERVTDSPLRPVVRTELADSGEDLFDEDVRALDLREPTPAEGMLEIQEVLLDAEL